MEFDDVVKRLRESSETRAHDDDLTGKRAAVATILRPGADGGEVLFIRRAEREGDPWSGHMAFPGGRRDPEDTSLVGTAVRETMEEVGLDLKTKGELVARLPDLRAMTKRAQMDLVVVPFVFVVREPVVLVPNEEVASTLWAPLGPLLRGEGEKPYDYRWAEVVYKLPSFEIEGQVVWGLTHRMLEQMGAALGLRSIR